MKFLTFKFNNIEQVGILSKDGLGVHPIKTLDVNYDTMNDLLENITNEEIEKLRTGLENSSYETISIKDLNKMAPIPNPKQDIICLGINYMAHAVESAKYKKEAFGGDSLDYEAELAVIIGKDAKDISKKDAFDYIFGYTIINDVSARNLQTRHKQWYFGKSLDGFTPMGPYIVTKDEFINPPVLNICSRVNGELRQNSSTDLMITSIEHVIHELSQGMTLKAGTIIAMGTPAGVGMGFDPPKFLKAGDIVECEIERIGCLQNIVK